MPIPFFTYNIIFLYTNSFFYLSHTSVLHPDFTGSLPKPGQFSIVEQFLQLLTTAPSDQVLLLIDQPNMLDIHVETAGSQEVAGRRFTLERGKHPWALLDMGDLPLIQSVCNLASTPEEQEDHLEYLTMRISHRKAPILQLFQEIVDLVNQRLKLEGDKPALPPMPFAVRPAQFTSLTAPPAYDRTGAKRLKLAALYSKLKSKLRHGDQNTDDNSHDPPAYQEVQGM